MSERITKVVIVGGGTAGWLAASLISARADRSADQSIQVTLIESPDIPTIGVGEGTWPTIRATLQRIGLSEAEFLLACDASFKQGSRFEGWTTGAKGDWYLHPFTAAPDADARTLLAAWDKTSDRFADAVTPQAKICAANLAPRQRAMPDYAGALNYAYHFDAGKFAAMLARHAVEKLGVTHIRDHVTEVRQAEDGDIIAVDTRACGEIAGDLFLDCTGQAALLIGERLGVPFVDRGHELFNDRALAVQIPVPAGNTIASQTNATAHAAGWIWDIGLPQRRGVGCVYASAYMDDDQAAATLSDYLRRTAPELDVDALSFRRLTFRSGHRERFWERNCVAVGLSGGFLEPLEASAIVTIELAVEALLAGWPTRATMAIHARRFNDIFRYRWDRIVEFLKLHYVLSQRDEPYWVANRDPASIPARLAELLQLWREQPPSATDFAHVDEVFPAASYQYVLYGMGFPAPVASAFAQSDEAAAANLARQTEQRARTLAASLPTNRIYLDALHGVAKLKEVSR